MRRRSRRGRWVIVEHENGTFDVLRNGRLLANQLSEQSVHRLLRSRSSPDDSVVRQESDGYQQPARLSDFTKHLRKV